MDPAGTARFAILVTLMWWRTLLLLMLAAGGCSSIRVTDPPRTATEQFLLSTAAAEAVGQLTFDSLRGRAVFVDTAYFAASEERFVLGELRARLLLAGVQLVSERDDAAVVLEVRSGGVGIDRKDFLLGIPSLLLTTEAEGTVGLPFQTPEIAFLKNLEQYGIASVAFVAYWRETGEVVASSGPYIGVSMRDDWWIFGFGPNSVGDIPPVRVRDEVEAAGAQPDATLDPLDAEDP